jgi:hypothetical protein
MSYDLQSNHMLPHWACSSVMYGAHTGAGSRKHEKTTHAKTPADERSEHKHRTNNDFKYAHTYIMGKQRKQIQDDKTRKRAETSERDTTPGSAAAGGSHNEHKNRPPTQSQPCVRPLADHDAEGWDIHGSSIVARRGQESLVSSQAAMTRQKGLYDGLGKRLRIGLRLLRWSHFDQSRVPRKLNMVALVIRTPAAPAGASGSVQLSKVCVLAAEES